MKDDQEVIKGCQEGQAYWVCFDCGDKYAERKPYDGTITVHSGVCDICHKNETVGPARKLFGFHRFF